MNINKITVPNGVRYISDWKGYGFHLTPGRCIINKTVPGCGFTEFYLRNSENVILASPRIMLLKNKHEQHEKEEPGMIFLVNNDLDNDPGVDRNIFKSGRRNTKYTPPKFEDTPEEEEEKIQIYEKIKNDLLKYMGEMDLKAKPYKILVTYDSYHIIKDILTWCGKFQSFTTMIDEFQSILDDSRFKSDTEMNFMKCVLSVEKIHFVSATPMLEKYLDMLPEFNGLTYYEIDWTTEDPTRLQRPSLDIKLMRSVNTSIDPIIKSYLDGKFDSVFRTDSTGGIERVISDEAVFYVNSVNHIISIIKRNGLTPDQCNILCSKTVENQKRIKNRLGVKFSIGKPPAKGIKPKMFTFCTRTVYLGADFYSLCARSFIFSDANLDCLSVDISQDLPQILGRQRLQENPWKNTATFFYRSIADYRKMTDEDFKKYVEAKKKTSHNLLEVVIEDDISLDKKKDLSNMYRFCAVMGNYKDNYVAVNIEGKSLVPVFNQYAYVSELRAFDIQQVDYADRFTVISEVSNLSKNSFQIQEVSSMLTEYMSLTLLPQRLKFICEKSFEVGKDSAIITLFLNQLPDSDYAKMYFLTVGPLKCRGLGYNISDLRRLLINLVDFTSDVLSKEIGKSFNVGQRYTRQYIKDEIGKIYDRIGYKATAKATDIELAFEVRIVRINENGKRVPGFELLSKK